MLVLEAYCFLCTIRRSYALGHQLRILNSAVKVAADRINDARPAGAGGGSRAGPEGYWPGVLDGIRFRRPLTYIGNETESRQVNDGFSMDTARVKNSGLNTDPQGLLPAATPGESS